MNSMKCFILHFSLFIFFLAGSARADGGDVLDRIVRLPGMKGTVYALLGKVSEQSGYLVIYDSKVIHNDSVVRVRKQECSVRQAIHRITGSRNLELKVLGNHILITRAAERKSMEETVPLPPRPAYSTIAGILLDKETGEPVVSASVIAQGTSLGNITNQNGEFRLNLPDSLRRCMLSFSHLGYVGQTVEASALEGRSNVLSLEPKVISLQEVLIRLVEPKKLLREMIEHRDRNCSTSPVYLTTFYREGVQLKNKFQSLTEAVFKVYKSPTMEPGQKDQVKLLKMSKIDNREQTDSVLAKISSMPTIITDRDHVIAAAGVSKREFLERRVTAVLEGYMENRKTYSATQQTLGDIQPIEGIEHYASVIYPIIAAGDVSGAVVMLTGEQTKIPSNAEIKLAQTAAAFLGKQMEE